MSTARTITGYELVDRHTGAILGRYTYAQRNRCRSRAHKLDNAYGAYRYSARPVFGEEA